MTGQRDLPAGGFSSWLGLTRAALIEEHGSEVPCGECCACCTTSHFVHVRPEEGEALARIPRELLFAAPDQPVGTLLLGYDEQGRCPMLTGGRCSIYRQRPLTCRTYDCRVFAAAGIDADRDLITRQARRWRFDHPTRRDRDEQAAVRAAARFLRERAECFPGGGVPDDPAQMAVLAVKVADVFIDPGGVGSDDDSAGPGRGRLDLDVAKAVMEASERFEALRAAAWPALEAGSRRQPEGPQRASGTPATSSRASGRGR